MRRCVHDRTPGSPSSATSWRQSRTTAGARTRSASVRLANKNGPPDRSSASSRKLNRRRASPCSRASRARFIGWNALSKGVRAQIPDNPACCHASMDRACARRIGSLGRSRSPQASLASGETVEDQARCETISTAVLNQRLKDLEAAGLMTRTSSGYVATEMGRRVYADLLPLGATARSWGRTISRVWRDRPGVTERRPVLFHTPASARARRPAVRAGPRFASCRTLSGQSNLPGTKHV